MRYHKTVCFNEAADMHDAVCINVCWDCSCTAGVVLDREQRLWGLVLHKYQYTLDRLLIEASRQGVGSLAHAA